MTISLIPVSLLLQGGPHPHIAFRGVQAAVKRSSGQMMALVHPWFAELHIYNRETERQSGPGRIFHSITELYREPDIYDSIKADFPHQDYLNYYARVKQRLSAIEWPVMILIGSGDENRTRRLLNLFDLRSKWAIEVLTRRRDPQPYWPGGAFLDKNTAWSRLANVVDQLGVTHLWISGELGFVNKSRLPVGCVSEAKKMFNQNGISVKLDHELIFPGVEWCSQED